MLWVYRGSQTENVYSHHGDRTHLVVLQLRQDAGTVRMKEEELGVWATDGVVLSKYAAVSVSVAVSVR